LQWRILPIPWKAVLITFFVIYTAALIVLAVMVALLPRVTLQPTGVFFVMTTINNLITVQVHLLCSLG
jgi:hypothetical protein